MNNMYLISNITNDILKSLRTASVARDRQFDINPVTQGFVFANTVRPVDAVPAEDWETYLEKLVCSTGFNDHSKVFYATLIAGSERLITAGLVRQVGSTKWALVVKFNDESKVVFIDDEQDESYDPNDYLVTRMLDAHFEYELREMRARAFAMS